jgi:rare lipoprotein A
MSGSSSGQTKWLWLGLVLAAYSCGGGEYAPPLAPPPRTAAAVEVREQLDQHALEVERHGFDPRPFYGMRALSVQRGAASFYADRFRGRKTANGERYNPEAYTCAHRTLPFGTVVRVVHERTGDWVLVRVNDRGPYAGKRIIDLSREAARRLAMLDEGVARVRLEVLQRGVKGAIPGRAGVDANVTRAEPGR